jgi:HAD superfamily phosphatase (TIGR01668 family)
MEKQNEEENNVGFFRKLFKDYYPTYIYENVESIPIELLKNNNIELILIDMDNTLVNNKYIYKKKLKEWIDMVKGDRIKVFIFSNSIMGKKVKRIASELGVEYYFNVSKPKLKGYKKIEEETKIPKEKIVMIGDQIFTDVLGGNRFGIKTILVNPICEKEIIVTKVKRPLERFILKSYLAKKGENK